MIIEIQWEQKTAQALLKQMQKFPEAILDSTRTATQYLRTLVIERTPWRSGHAASAWSNVEYRDGGFSFGNPVPYTAHLELGWDPGNTEKGAIRKAGPHTVELNGRIYSNQAPGGIIGPLVYDEAIKRRMIAKVIAGFKAAING